MTLCTIFDVSNRRKIPDTNLYTLAQAVLLKEQKTFLRVSRYPHLLAVLGGYELLYATCSSGLLWHLQTTQRQKHNKALKNCHTCESAMTDLEEFPKAKHFQSLFIPLPVCLLTHLLILSSVNRLKYLHLPIDANSLRAPCFLPASFPAKDRGV